MLLENTLFFLAVKTTEHPAIQLRVRAHTHTARTAAAQFTRQRFSADVEVECDSIWPKAGLMEDLCLEYRH